MRSDVLPPDHLVVLADGSAREREGLAAVGVSLTDAAGLELAVRGVRVPFQDSNIVELLAAAEGLRLARDRGARAVLLVSDNADVVGFARGHKTLTRARQLRPVCDVRRLLDGFDAARVMHIERRYNWRADAIAAYAIRGEQPPALLHVPLRRPSTGWFLSIGEWHDERRRHESAIAASM